MNKTNLKTHVVHLLVMLLVSSICYGQDWGKQYDNFSKMNQLDNAKGDFNTFIDHYVVTGVMDNATLQDFAYLLETDVSGTTSWNVLLGDNQNDFSGTAVKTTSSGNYIVVGKTTKHQLYPGAYSDSCLLVTPYYNAFVAHIDPDSSANNWFKIIGNENLHDEFVEVIEDANGDFWCVGSADGKYAADSCFLNDTSFVQSSGIDQSEVLVCKFDQNGNTLLKARYGNSKFDRGVSIIENNTLFSVLISDRNQAQTGLIQPAILNLDGFGNVLSAHHYGAGVTYDIAPKELVKLNGDIVIVGNKADITRTPYTSYWLVVNGSSVIDYSELTHFDTYILYKDLIVDNDTLIVSASSQLANFGNWKTQTTQKAVLNPFGQIQLVSQGSINTHHYHSYGHETNENITSYSYLDHLNNYYDGYHLFGNTSSDRLDHVRTNRTLNSTCELDDSLALDSVLMPSSVETYLQYQVDSLGIFELYPTAFVLTSDCDTISKPMAMPLSQNDITLSQNTLYPNPTAGALHIKLDQLYKSGQLIVYDIQGRSVGNLSFSNSDHLTYDTKNLIKGQYLVEIRTTRGASFHRFIKN